MNIDKFILPIATDCYNALNEIDMNRAAQSLGRRAKGVPKNYSPEEIAVRTQRLADARHKRWMRKADKLDADLTEIAKKLKK